MAGRCSLGLGPSTSLSVDLAYSPRGSVSLTATAEPCSSATGPEFPSTPTSVNSEPTHHELKSFTAATPVSRSPREDGAAARMTRGIFGPSSLACLAFYNPESRSWKTSRDTLLSDSQTSSPTWSKWGMTRGGEAFELPTPAPLTRGNDSSSLLPTPAAQEPGGTVERHLWRKNRHDGANRVTPTHLSLIVQLLPTPSANDHTGGKNETSRGGGPSLRGIVPILSGASTPQRSDGGNGSQGDPHPDQMTIGDA